MTGMMAVLAPVISKRSDDPRRNAGGELPFYARSSGSVPPPWRAGRGSHVAVAAAAQLRQLDGESAIIVTKREAVGEGTHDEDAAAAFAHRIGSRLVAHGFGEIEPRSLVRDRGDEGITVEFQSHNDALVLGEVVTVLDGVAARFHQCCAHIVDGILRKREIAREILNR